jgi:hypothetical protein
MNCLTPLIADDYSYSLGIHSVADIIKYQYGQWLGWGGRSVAHFLAQFWLLLGKPFFNIANTLVYCGFIFLTCFHINGNSRPFKPALFFAINVFYWFLVPAWGQNFLWLDGSCNYLWTTTIILLFLAPFRKKYDVRDYKLPLPLSMLFFSIGVLAGWSNENSAAAVLCLLAAYFVIKKIRKEKISFFEITGCVGFLTGFILLIAAPGNYVRAGVIREMGGSYYNDTLILMLLKRFVDVTRIFFRNYGFTVMAAAVFFAVDLLYHQKRRLNLFSYFYALAALAGVYSMMLSPFFPDRAFLIVMVFAGITLGSVLVQFELHIPVMLKRNSFLFAGMLLFLLSFSVLKAGRNITSIYLRWQNRVEYILAEKERGNLDLAVQAPIPAADRHTALYGLTDIGDDKTEWPNTSIAEYFGLRSIKRLENDEPWESVW